MAKHILNKYTKEKLRERGRRIADHLGLDARKITCYENIFRYLRTQDPNKVREGLVLFYGGSEGEEDYFQNGREVGEYIFRILGINWFKPKRKHSTEEISSYVKNITRVFKIRELESEVVNNKAVALDAAKCFVSWGTLLGDAWATAMGAACDAVSDAGLIAARGTVLGGEVDGLLSATYIATSYAAGGFARDIARCVAADSAAKGACYIVAQDVPGLKRKYPENPFEKLIDVYELGLCPAGIRGDKFVIWHPKI